ncbi:Suppressor of Sensor Kinase (SLN1) [Irineochytrium annulatum]|nr:Suppressor of Sensor Kinase (SLN1) [Irineochytrium annulatum]
MNMSSVSSLVSLLSVVMDEEGGAGLEGDAEGGWKRRRSARPRSLLLDQQIEALSGYIHELYAEFTSDETAAAAATATAKGGGGSTAGREESALAEVMSPAVGAVIADADDDDDEDSDAEAEVDYLSSIFPNWTVGRLLGSGTSGMVFEAMHPSTMKPLFAIKKERIVNSHPWLPMPTLFSTIVKVLRLADHPNVMRFYGVESVGDEMYIFMEFCAGGSLGDVIYHRGGEDEGLKPGIRDVKLVKKWIRMALEGLRYCHRHNIVHRDLKPGNLLIAEDGTLKIGDFGGAKVHQTCCDQPHLTQMFGSPSYMAPEIITSSAEGPKGAQDIWSLGCCLFEMVLGKPPWYQLDNVFALYYLMGSWAKRAEALQTEVGGGMKRGGCEKHAGAYAEQAARMEGRWGVGAFGGASVWGGKVGGGDDEEDGEESENERIRDSDLTDSDFSDESDSEAEEEERMSVKDRPSSVATEGGLSKRGSAMSIKSRVASVKGMSLAVLMEDWDAEEDEGDEGLYELTRSLHATFEDEGYVDDEDLDLDNSEEGYDGEEDDAFEGDADPIMSAFYLSRVESRSSLERSADNSGDNSGSSLPTSPRDELDRLLASRRKMRRDEKRVEDAARAAVEPSASATAKTLTGNRPESILSSVTNSTTSKTTHSNPSTVSSSTPTPSRASDAVSSSHGAPSSSSHHRHHRHRRHYRKRPSLATTQALPKPLPVPGGKVAKREREAILESAGTSACMLSAQDCLMRSKALSNPLMTIALESGLFGYEALDFL